jgi:hypothetical protein
MNEWLTTKKSDSDYVTLFCSKALANCCTAGGLISLPPRARAMSVCKEKEVSSQTRNKLCE